MTYEFIKRRMQPESDVSGLFITVLQKYNFITSFIDQGESGS